MRWFFAVVLILVLLAPLAAQARLLKNGMSGLDVRELQELLAGLGHRLAVDGIFGAETRALVIRIQKELDLRADGIVGPQTEKALRRLQDGVVLHTVQPGDNLSTLARYYQTTVKGIASLNGLKNPDRLFPGQILLIPTRDSPVLAPGMKERLDLSWPLDGPITSGYGYRLHPITRSRDFHGGIDIGAPVGTPVRAAQAGKVIQAGNAGNYGLAVVLDHGREISTWYGHNSKLLVSVGETVQKGQIIAYSGCSGRVTGPHLDFRIKIRDQTLDPLEFLP